MATAGTVIDFYKLTRPVQERFRGSVNGSGLPAPILALRRQTKEPLAWLGLSALSAFAAFVLFQIGLGNLDSSFAIHGAPLVALYTAFFGAFVFGILKALAIRRESRSLPFVPGIYLFPIGLVDARRHCIRLYSMRELTASEGPDASNTFHLVFGGNKKFVFPVGDAQRAQKAAAALASARTTHDEAEGARDSIRPKAIAAIDPLQDGGFASPLVPKTPIVQNVPFWAAKAWLVALAAGFLLATGVWNARNVLSDSRMFATANEAHDTSSYKHYLERGTRHHDEVEKVLLPRAELKDAQKAGTVDAIEAYIKTHKGTKIGPELTAARRAALLVELEATKKIGTLTSLKEFAKDHPDHGLDAELKVAMHEVYEAAFEKYKANDAAKDPIAIAFVRKVIDFAEKKGPKVVVRFQRHVAKAMERADKDVVKSKSFMGVASFPSRYFDAVHAKPREQELAKTIIERFAQAFPADILALEMGEPIADPDAQVGPPTDVPTLLIEHSVDWTGGEVTSTNPRGVFIMMGVNFESSFGVPGDPKEHKLKLTVWRRPEPNLAKDTEHPEEIIYAEMTKGAYEQFGKKYLITFFRAPPSEPKK
jgi:hypothetical protein